jgi:pimeloyl-ACP methyl ester carboxylesterase
VRTFTGVIATQLYWTYASSLKNIFVSHIPWYVAYPLIAAVAYGALYWFANRSVYFPSKYPEGSWDVQAQLGAADVWVAAADGVRNHGWQVDRRGAQFVTLYFHGNAGNITDRYDHFREIASAGSSVLMIDYRGYGKSSGRPTEEGFYRDADAAYDHLIRVGRRADQIILHGESLGTAVAVDLASRRPCAGVVLEAPFTSGKDVARTVLPVIGPLVIWSFDSRKKIGRIHAPILIIHGDRDEIIPTRLGQALFEAAPEPKSIWIVPGAHHNDIVETAGANYRQHLQSFYESLASQK